jgi:serine/threonine protein kinase
MRGQLGEIASGLEFLHNQKVIHCDLKPGSKWQDQRGVQYLPIADILVDEPAHARIADFGLVVVGNMTSDRPKTERFTTTTRIRPPEYLPEEGDASNVRPSSSVDVYAFACVCYQVSMLFECDMHRYS